MALLVLPSRDCFIICFGFFRPLPLSLLTRREVIGYADINFFSETNTDPVKVHEGLSDLESDCQQILRAVPLTLGIKVSVSVRERFRRRTAWFTRKMETEFLAHTPVPVR